MLAPVQRSGTTHEWDAEMVDVASGSIFSSTEGHVIHVRVLGDSLAEAVEYKDGSVILDPSLLVIGMPQSFNLEGQQFTVIRNLDNSIDFFESPSVIG